MELRPYQSEAVEAVYQYLRDRDDNPCVVIPTAGGKTPILATIVRDSVQKWNGRILILSHVKELLSQAVDKIHTIYPECDIGLYSAGLKSRETDHKCIVAGIQSVYRKAEALGKFDLIIVDEAHLIPVEGEGMYRRFLTDMKDINPIVRVVGLTATPFRLSCGPICAPGNILNSICYEVGVKELLQQKYLCPLRSKETKHVIDTSGLHIRAGEFIDSEAESLMDRQEVVEQACAEIASYARDRKSVLVFCCSIRHGKNVLAELRKYDRTAEAVFGDSLPIFRAETLENFKVGKIKYLVNVGVLTTIWKRERAASQRYSDGDNTGYLEIYRDDVTYADTFCPRILNGKAEVTAYFGAVPKIRIEKVEWSNEHLSLNESGNMAILTYNQQNYIRGKNDDILHTMPLWHCVEVYLLADGEWKIAHANWSLAQHPAVMKSFQALFAQLGY